MNSASIRYDLQNIDNLRYLLCLAREFFAETGMLPAELNYHGQCLSYNSIEANAVIKGALDEKEYIERNSVKE